MTLNIQLNVNTHIVMNTDHSTSGSNTKDDAKSNIDSDVNIPSPTTDEHPTASAVSTPKSTLTAANPTHPNTSSDIQPNATTPPTSEATKSNDDDNNSSNSEAHLSTAGQQPPLAASAQATSTLQIQSPIAIQTQPVHPNPTTFALEPDGQQPAALAASPAHSPTSTQPVHPNQTAFAASEPFTQHSPKTHASSPSSVEPPQHQMFPNMVTQLTPQRQSLPPQPPHNYHHQIETNLSNDGMTHSNIMTIHSDDLLVHPEHPYGSSFWDIVSSSIELSSSVNLIDDIIPFAYQIMDNFELGITGNGESIPYQLSRHPNIDNEGVKLEGIVNLLPPTAHVFAKKKIYKNLRALPLSGAGGGDGDGDGGNGDDDDDDLDSDEEDDDDLDADAQHWPEKIQIKIGQKMSIQQEVIPQLLELNRLLAGSHAALMVMETTVKATIVSMSEHHHMLATEHRSLVQIIQHLKRTHAHDPKTLVNVYFPLHFLLLMFVLTSPIMFYTLSHSIYLKTFEISAWPLPRFTKHARRLGKPCLTRGKS